MDGAWQCHANFCWKSHSFLSLDLRLISNKIPTCFILAWFEEKLPGKEYHLVVQSLKAYQFRITLEMQRGILI